MGTESTTPSPPADEPSPNYVRAGLPVTGDLLIGPPPSAPPSPRAVRPLPQTDPQATNAPGVGESARDPRTPRPSATTPTSDTRSLWASRGTAVTSDPYPTATTQRLVAPTAATAATPAPTSASNPPLPQPNAGSRPAIIIPPPPTTGPTPYVGTLGPFRDQLARDRAQGIAAPAEATNPASETPPPPPVALPARSERSGSVVAWIRAVTILLKFSPALLALGGAFYFYQSMFGKMSADELAAQGMAAPAAAKQGGMSRAEVMMHQTKSVVAAQNRHVDFANQLAELGTNAVDPNAVVAPPPAPAPVVVAPEPPPAAEPPPPPAPPPVTVYAASGSPRELVFSGPPPSPAFVRWARESRLSGVRASETSARAMVDNIVYNIGDTVHRPLRIVLEKVDSRAMVVIFRDASGSTVARPF